MTPIPVRAAAPVHRVAVADLPASARPTDDPRGAIAMIDGGAGWPRELERLRAEGAIGAVVTDPVPAPAEELRALARGGFPVAVARPRLCRGDVARVGVRRGLSVVSASGAAPAEGVEALARDAVGWARELAGGAVRLVSARREGGALSVRAQAGTVPVSLLITTATAPRTLLDVVAVAPERVEIRVDDARGPCVVDIVREEGRLSAPARFETPEREALRAAIAAAASGAVLDDLDRFADDGAVAARIVGR